MSVTKQKDGRWLVSCRPHGGEGPYYRRLVKTRTEAKRLEAELTGNSVSNLDGALLSHCIKVWYDYFGVSLKDGVKRKAKLIAAMNAIGDRRVSKLKSTHYLEYRKQRLESGITPNTCNHDLVYLKTLFNKLKKSGQVSFNPFENISPMKIDERELSYLTNYQMLRVLAACRNSINESVFPVVCLCLATGARWGEVEKLTFNQIDWGSVTFTKTKNGKIRRVPIDHEMFIALRDRKKYRQERVFSNCWAAFRGAIQRARVVLPKGQMTHVLRHTFASHFVMNGGDILTLQSILGHSDVKVTMRYAHLSPDHLRDAIKLNPLSNLR